MASYVCCCFLLQLLFGAVTGLKMLAYSGMPFPLFTNLTFHEHITLFKNGNEKPEIIARWETKNATITSEWKSSDYLQKIFIKVLDKTLIIWICNLDQTYSAKYEVIYDIKTTGPEVELTIMENKQLDVCVNSPPNSPEKCFGNLEEEQVVQYMEKFLDDHPQYIKRDFENLTGQQIGEEVRKWLADHPEYIKEYLGTLPTEQIGQVIRELLDDYTGNLSGQQIREEVRKWLADHPEYIKGSRGNVTREQIQQDVRKWLADHPEYIKEYLGSCNPLFLGLLIASCIIGMLILIGIIIILCIQPTDRIKIRKGLLNTKDWIQKKFCCKHKFENEPREPQGTVIDIEETELSKEDQVHKWLNDHPDFMDKYLGKLTENQICMQIQKWEDAYPGLVKNKDLDEIVKYDTATNPTLIELAVTWRGTEDNQVQLESSQEDATSITYSSRSSGTFSEPDHSGAQPFNYDEQDANSEQDMAHDVGEVKEDSDTEDKCQEPLLTEGSC